ncbi:MAG: hypothetical protein FOGNACKC_00770 [Anaerolineae bacterium]|nr:hypothetical protein [Anaerolineae bacterium]
MANKVHFGDLYLGQRFMMDGHSGQKLFHDGGMWKGLWTHMHPYEPVEPIEEPQYAPPVSPGNLFGWRPDGQIMTKSLLYFLGTQKVRPLFWAHGKTVYVETGRYYIDNELYGVEEGSNKVYTLTDNGGEINVYRVNQEDVGLPFNGSIPTEISSGFPALTVETVAIWVFNKMLGRPVEYDFRAEGIPLIGYAKVGAEWNLTA